MRRHVGDTRLEAAIEMSNPNPNPDPINNPSPDPNPNPSPKPKPNPNQAAIEMLRAIAVANHLAQRRTFSLDDARAALRGSGAQLRLCEEEP